MYYITTSLHTKLMVMLGKLGHYIHLLAKEKQTKFVHRCEGYLTDCYRLHQWLTEFFIQTKTVVGIQNMFLNP